MAKNPVETYFDYVENVLGIKQVLTSRIEFSVPVGAIEVPLLITVSELLSYSEAENELLYKMVAALKLDPTNYVVIDTSNADGYNSNVELRFVDNPGASNETQIQTFSPRILLTKPELKKQAWTEMQKVQQKI
jgi:hypothetical protein